MSGEYTHRDEARDRSPSWLATGLNEKILLSLTVIVDALGDALVQGIKSRYPNYVDPSTLGLIGSERRIRRGLTEADGPYAERLTHWWDAYRTIGSPYTLLEQMGIRYAYAFSIELIYRNGRRYTLATDGTITRDVVADWSPDDRPDQWARWWMICYSDDFTTPDAQADLAIIPREWNAAHCNGAIIVLGAGAALINYHPPHLIDEPDTIDTPNAAVYIEV